MRALDLLNADYNFPYAEKFERSNRGNGYNIVRRYKYQTLKIYEFIEKENKSEKEFNMFRQKVKNAIIFSYVWQFGISGAALGFVIGFIRGCNMNKFSQDTGTLFGTFFFITIASIFLGVILGINKEIKEE
jgi:hypothetical protein